MLPDFPKSRKELSEKLRLHIRLRVQDKSPWAALGREYTQHEGRAFSYEQIIDESKRIVETGYEEMVVPIRVEFKDIPDLIGEALFRKLDEIADNIAEQTSRLGQRRLSEATQLAGTAIDAGGQPFTQELFLKSENARDWEFNHLTGQQEGVYIAHPQTAERMHNLWQEWEKDLAFMKRVAELKARKYEEWRDRESRRKLVD
jgi:hypothetical protein